MSVPSDRVFEFRPGERAALAELLRARAEALRRLVIAIDGPAGSGKSTTARAVADRLGLLHLDTGAMYRAVTLLALGARADLEDGLALGQLAAKHAIDFRAGPGGPRVLLDGKDVTEAVRGPEVTREVSRVAAHPEVRRRMVARQRALGERGGVVVDGRDIGTVVFPRAGVKVFLTADAPTRVRRRQQEDAARGRAADLAALEVEIERRDRADSTRAASPLLSASDAVLLDTSDLDFDEQVDAVLALAARAAGGEKVGGEIAPGPRVEAVPIDPRDWTQPGYRPFHPGPYRIVHPILRWLGRILFGTRIEMHPSARLAGSVLVACNHVAGIDPPLVGSSLPFEAWFIAKLELFRNAALGRLLAHFNAVPIRRGTADYAALDRAVQLLGAGRNVFLFPEGTRQVPGRLGTARWGFGYVALRAGRPVLPVFVRGTRDTRPRFLRRQSIEVWIGEPFALRWGPGAKEHALYKAIGEVVMDRLAGLMLRSAARNPLPGLELPGVFGAAAVPFRTEDLTTRAK